MFALPNLTGSSVAKAKGKNFSKEKTVSLRNDSIRELRSLIDGQEIERQRLSRELHDGIGQSLIAVKLNLESLSFLKENEIHQKLAQIRIQFDGIIDEIRRISTDLMPAVLDEFGIVIAVRNLCNEIAGHTGLKIDLVFSGQTEELSRKRKTYLYRIVQEALHNVVKHYSATEVQVKLSREADRIHLNISDNGTGFDPGHPGTESGHGLQNIRDRVKLLRGKLNIDSRPGTGTSIHAIIPFYS